MPPAATTPPVAKPHAPARRDGRAVVDAYERLRAAILTRRIEPGTHLTQVAIARELGLGRTPLREAIRMLERDGLLRLEPNQRVHVAPLTAADIEEIYAMRISLESLAICKTVPTFTARDIAELEELCAAAGDEAAARESGDRARIERAQAAHNAFHARFIGGAGARLSAAVAQLTDHAERYRLVDLMPSSYDDREATRRAMLAAGARRDGNEVADVFGAHCVRSAHALIDELRAGPAKPLFEIALERSLAS